MRPQDVCGSPVGGAHPGERHLDPGSARLAPHGAREQHARAERLGQDQPVARLEPALTQHLERVNRAVHRKAERKLGAFARVAADQHHVLTLQDRESAREDLI